MMSISDTRRLSAISEIVFTTIVFVVILAIIVLFHPVHHLQEIIIGHTRKIDYVWGTERSVYESVG